MAGLTRPNRFSRHAGFGGGGFLVSLGLPFRPNVESAAHQYHLPRSPDAFALSEASIKHIVRADVRLGPVAFPVHDIVLTADDEAANVIDPLADHLSIRELQLEIHPMTVTHEIVVRGHSLRRIETAMAMPRMELSHPASLPPITEAC